MTTTSTLVYEAETYLNKKKIKLVYTVGGILFAISVGSILWASANWDEYTEVVWSVKYGRYVEAGLAPILYGWGWGFAIFIPIIYGLMWFSFDFKNPSFAVNRDGIFINRELFKKTFLAWNEFDRIEKKEEGHLWLYLKDAEKIVNQQPGWRKPFLKQTYVKDGAPISVTNDEKHEKIIQAIERYSTSNTTS